MRKGKIVTEEPDMRKGVLQGCPLPPLMPRVCNERGTRRHVENGVKNGGLQINADDIILLAESLGKLQVMANSVYTACSKYKLGIDKQRSKAINVGREREA